MDGSVAIERNWEALKRILVMLVGMAEMGASGRFVFSSQKDGAIRKQVQAEKREPSPASDPALILPRHLYRAILRLLRPAEAATRRLIIAAARGIVVALPRPRKPKPDPAIRRGPRAFMPMGPKKRLWPTARTWSLPLLDPLHRPFRVHRPHLPAHAAPRISWLDFNARLSPLPPPPSPDDPIDAARLGARLEALGRALDDLPGQAKRFARWQARRDATLSQGGSAAGRSRRISPLRRGRPPGCRLSRYDPSADHPRRVREVDEILAHAHALAVYALERPNTS
ncbi:hypothetical protein ACSBOB_18020 [Mesorhizobium sp. ASY16-5R]|uniref:hypothetical protein n=1 Tax=Mesorhizobium sp. ASY16-5R TaxID=3445772 RepID=UPI003F9ED2E7